MSSETRHSLSHRESVPETDFWLQPSQLDVSHFFIDDVLDGQKEPETGAFAETEIADASWTEYLQDKPRSLQSSIKPLEDTLPSFPSQNASAGGKPAKLESSNPPKKRLRWSEPLCKKFQDAVDALGGPDKATPKTLKALIGVEGLTIYHIKSRLQKYRMGSRAAAADAIIAASKHQGQASKPCQSSNSDENSSHGATCDSPTQRSMASKPIAVNDSSRWSCRMGTSITQHELLDENQKRQVKELDAIEDSLMSRSKVLNYLMAERIKAEEMIAAAVAASTSLTNAAAAMGMQANANSAHPQFPPHGIPMAVPYSGAYMYPPGYSYETVPQPGGGGGPKLTAGRDAEGHAGTMMASQPAVYVPMASMPTQQQQQQQYHMMHPPMGSPFFYYGQQIPGQAMPPHFMPTNMCFNPGSYASSQIGPVSSSSHGYTAAYHPSAFQCGDSHQEMGQHLPAGSAANSQLSLKRGHGVSPQSSSQSHCQDQSQSPRTAPELESGRDCKRAQHEGVVSPPPEDFMSYLADDYDENWVGDSTPEDIFLEQNLQSNN